MRSCALRISWRAAGVREGDRQLSREGQPAEQEDVNELAAALQRIEDKLDRFLPASAAASALPRAARTRAAAIREASAAAAKVPAAAPARLFRREKGRAGAATELIDGRANDDPKGHRSGALGFRAEALLARHVPDRGGTLHDLVRRAHDVDVVHTRMQALGLSDALGA